MHVLELLLVKLPVAAESLSNISEFSVSHRKTQKLLGNPTLGNSSQPLINFTFINVRHLYIYIYISADAFCSRKKKNNPIPFSLGCCLEKKNGFFVLLFLSVCCSRQSNLQILVFFIIRKRQREGKGKLYHQ